MAKTEILTFQITEDLRDKIKRATDDAIKTALDAIGRQAVSFAVYHCTEQGVVDTGLLRNSLTYALGGEQVRMAAAYSGDRESKYGGNKAKKSGRYSGVAPADNVGERMVYIGTNVEYAIYNELGWKSRRKKHAARPFLRPALERHTQAYAKIFESVLSKLSG